MQQSPRSLPSRSSSAVEALGGGVDYEPSLRVSAVDALEVLVDTRASRGASQRRAPLPPLSTTQQVKPAKLGSEAKQDNSPNLGRPRSSPWARPAPSLGRAGRRAPRSPRIAGRGTLFPAERTKQGRGSSAPLSAETRCIASAVTPVGAPARGEASRLARSGSPAALCESPGLMGSRVRGTPR